MRRGRPASRLITPSPRVPQICDTLSELAGKIPDADVSWPELLPFIFQCVQSGETRMMESALFIFGDLARSMMPTLMQYMGTLHQVRSWRHLVCLK